MPRILFITGTDTGVGKTELTALLARFLQSRAIPFRAVKPFCSGGRADARRLWQVQRRALPLDVVNPWHYRAPMAPLVAARLERRRSSPGRVIDWLRRQALLTDVLVVEGAGGLLSPLAEGLDSRSLIVRLRALPVIVCPNRLGAINQALLAVEAMPAGCRRRAVVVLSEVRKPDRSAASNVRVLAERLGRDRVMRLPRLNAREREVDGRVPVKCRKLLRALVG